jgi:hypothetical protein
MWTDIYIYDIELCCRIVLVLGCLHLGKNGETMQKNGIGKCKSERGTHDNCGKNGKAQCKLKRGKNCKWRKNRKSKCNLERGTFDK